MSPDRHARTMLPIPDRPAPGLTTYDAKDPDTAFPPIEPLLPPEGAPNVLIVLLDDVGFGASSTFGGPCRTPTAERLAAGGLRYNRFHTTALCAPTRQALLTGRNHHSVGMGSITETATSAPGNSSLRPNTKAPLAMTLKLNGYSTAQFGKCHEVPVWQSSPMGPFDAWPSGGGGFETFYGFIGGENNQWDPALYDGTTPVEPPATPEEGYHLTEDLADQAISWVRQQKALMPDKPFFVYFAPGATHAPHHVPKEWADRYQGEFDDGWDVQRERTFARQKELGVIPADAELTARHDEIPAWDDMPDELKPVLARQMEVYAGFLEHTDHHVGRLIDAIEDLGVLDDTIVYYIIGDNGASAEGTHERRLQRDGQLQRDGRARDARVHGQQDGRVRLARAPTTTTRSAGRGRWTPRSSGPSRSPRTGAAPATARSCTGPTGIERARRAALAVHPRDRRRADDPRGRRPARADDGQRRAAVAHGGHQHAVHASTTPTRPERHDLQYFEMFGNRGIYHKGWSAVTKHRTPWVMVGGDDAGVRRRRLGALRRQQRLQPGPQPRRRAARDARQAAAALADRGHQVQRAAARRPQRRTARPRDGRATDADPRATRSCSSPAWAGCRRTAWSASRTSRSRSPPRSTSPTAAPRA